MLTARVPCKLGVPFAEGQCKACRNQAAVCPSPAVFISFHWCGSCKGVKVGVWQLPKEVEDPELKLLPDMLLKTVLHSRATISMKKYLGVFTLEGVQRMLARPVQKKEPVTVEMLAELAAGTNRYSTLTNIRLTTAVS